MGNTAGNLGTTWGWNLGENNWKASHDKNLRALDALTQAHIIERVLTTPPASPADGDCYIPATGATGAWAGQANNFARWNGISSVWEFWTPRKGWMVFNESDNYSYRWNGTAWEGCNFSFAQLNASYIMAAGETRAIVTTSYINATEIRTSNSPRITTGGVGQFTGLTSTGGGTFTGDVTVQKTTSGETNILISALTGNYASLRLTTAGSDRWLFRKTPTSESGSNVGSDVELCAMSDAGNLIDRPIQIARIAGGPITLSRPLTMNGATRKTWGTVLAKSTHIGGTVVLGENNFGNGSYARLSVNWYNDGTNSRAIESRTGYGYPASISINDSGTLGFETSLTNPTADGIISDFALRWSVSRQGGCGFFGATAPTSQPSVTGSRGGNAALASLLSALAACGIISNATSA